MLKIENLSVAYKRGERVLKDISVVFDKKTLLLGPNGAGKTTLFRTICGLTTKISGQIYINGEDADSIFGKTGYVVTNLPEVYNLVYTDAYGLLEVYMDILDGDLELALKFLEEFGLSKSFLRKTKIHQMSAGQRKIFMNAIVLAVKAKVKLLDEPFEQLDPAKKSMLIDLLEKEDSLVVLSTHATWLIEKLAQWDAAFMFEGQIHGKIPTNEILGLYLIYEEAPNAVLTVKTSSITFSLIREQKGRRLEDFMSLDYIYKLA